MEFRETADSSSPACGTLRGMTHPKRFDQAAKGRALLHKTHFWRGLAARRRLLDGSELCLIPRDILAQRPPNAFRVCRVHDHAAQQLPLRSIRENIDKVQRELFQVVVNHHQIAVLSLQLFLIRLDLYLTLRRPLLVHRLSLPKHLHELIIAALSPPALRLVLLRRAPRHVSSIDSAPALSVV